MGVEAARRDIQRGETLHAVQDNRDTSTFWHPIVEILPAKSLIKLVRNPLEGEASGGRRQHVPQNERRDRLTSHKLVHDSDDPVRLARRPNVIRELHVLTTVHPAKNLSDGQAGGPKP